LQLGLPIVTPENVYETSVELTKAADFSSPDLFWTNPQKMPPPANQGPPPEVQLAQMEATKDLHLKAAEFEQRTKEKTADVEIEKYKIDTEARTKLALAHLQHEHGMEGEHTKAQLSDQSMKMQSELASEDDAVEAEKIVTAVESSNEQQTQQVQQIIDQFAEKLTAMMEALQKSVTAPRMVIRDKDGRPIGAKVVQ